MLLNSHHFLGSYWSSDSLSVLRTNTCAVQTNKGQCIKKSLITVRSYSGSEWIKSYVNPQILVTYRVSPVLKNGQHMLCKKWEPSMKMEESEYVKQLTSTWHSRMTYLVNEDLRRFTTGHIQSFGGFGKRNNNYHLHLLLRMNMRDIAVSHQWPHTTKGYRETCILNLLRDLLRSRSDPRVASVVAYQRLNTLKDYYRVQSYLISHHAVHVNQTYSLIRFVLRLNDALDYSDDRIQ